MTQSPDDPPPQPARPSWTGRGLLPTQGPPSPTTAAPTGDNGRYGSSAPAPQYDQYAGTTPQPNSTTPQFGTPAPQFGTPAPQYGGTVPRFGMPQAGAAGPGQGVYGAGPRQHPPAPPEPVPAGPPPAQFRPLSAVPRRATWAPVLAIAVLGLSAGFLGAWLDLNHPWRGSTATTAPSTRHTATAAAEDPRQKSIRTELDDLAKQVSTAAGVQFRMAERAPHLRQDTTCQVNATSMRCDSSGTVGGGAIVVTRGVTYWHADTRFMWANLDLPSTVTARFVDRWVVLPGATGNALENSPLLVAAGTLQRAEGPLAERTGHLDGQAVHVITAGVPEIELSNGLHLSGANATFSVVPGAHPQLLRCTVRAKNLTMTLDYHSWGRAVTVRAPAGAERLTDLAHP